MYGIMEGAVSVSADELLSAPPEDKSKKLVVCCARGQFSVDTAESLSEMGYDACSLSGGYAAWLLALMQKEQADEVSKRVEQSLQKKFRKKIWAAFTKAVKQYELVKENDRIAVCISGGKDSMLMAKLFQELHRHSDFPFEVKFIVMDPGYSIANRNVIEENARKLKIPIEIFESDIFDSVYNVEKSPCYLCARMRRGHLYNYAKSLGCNKIALGHHYDDVIETILMGMLYGAQIQTMMPKLHSTNFEGMELIRPLYRINEKDIISWCKYNSLEFIRCACRFTENDESSHENISKRKEIKDLIAELKKINPNIEKNIFNSIHTANFDTLPGYKIFGEEHTFLDYYYGDKNDRSI